MTKTKKTSACALKHFSLTLIILIFSQNIFKVRCFIIFIIQCFSLYSYPWTLDFLFIYKIYFLPVMYVETTLCLFQASVHFNENILTLNYKSGDVNTRRISIKIYLKED